MPLIKTKNGCYKFGESGKEYCGKDAKKKALKQGAAIEIQKNKEKASLNEFLELTTAELFDALMNEKISAGERWATIKKFEELKHGRSK